MRPPGRMVLWLLACVVAASAAETTSHGQTDPISTGLIALATVMFAAKLGAEILERLRQPAVLGELLIGIALGGLGLAGFDFISTWKNNEVLIVAAELGVILLLFEVGLESHLNELLEVGLSALMVAMIGVVGPMVLGYYVSAFFLPQEAWYVHLFVGGTLAATSVGITARVLRDLKKVDTKEGRIILGAAVVDDVLGLIVLAVITGIISSTSSGASGGVSPGVVLLIILKAVVFLIAAVLGGRILHLNAVRAGTRFRVPGVPLVIAVGFCFAMSAIAGLVGLAPIVGAFAAGLVLEPSDYETYRERGEQPIEHLVHPLTTLLTPVFFVMMGMQVDLRAFASPSVLAFAAVITLAAILGKQICSIGILEKGVSRIVVGVGMIPRGEVGLIFTAMGARLMVGSEPVFSSDTVSAMVITVIVTTLVTPPVLKMLLQRAEVAGQRAALGTES